MISHIASMTLYSLAQDMASSLTLRRPSRLELASIKDGLRPSAKDICDVASLTLAGFFDSEPDAEERRCGDQLAKLPVMIPIEGLEPGCARKVFLGIKLPETVEVEEDTAAFMLVE
jgi:hypothetical protein